MNRFYKRKKSNIQDTKTSERRGAMTRKSTESDPSQRNNSAYILENEESGSDSDLERFHFTQKKNIKNIKSKALEGQQ